METVHFLKGMRESYPDLTKYVCGDSAYWKHGYISGFIIVSGFRDISRVKDHDFSSFLEELDQHVRKNEILHNIWML